MEPILQVKDLTVSFNAYAGTVQAVRGVSFDLNPHETLAIVGESGSGKSVTIKAILGILPKNGRIVNGEIWYQGEDMAKYSESDFYKIRGKKISLVFQDPLSALNPIMKIGKQITEALILSKSIEKSKAKERAIELMEAVGIPDPEIRYDQYPFQFSGGMRQRIVIAIALASNPELLICDEPTTALDVTIQAKILDLINEIKRRQDLSIIFITHDMGVVANMADRICVMYAGKIVEFGTANEIFYEPAHPYTWALLSAMPDLDTKEKLFAIPGAPPNMLVPPKGDAFAARNKYALELDFEEEPPYFKLSDTHYAATWLLHPDAPKVEMPEILKNRIQRMKEKEAERNGRQ
ncbi:MAG: ABC transporter ATP-binding protein [Firmicutes bacterium]|nr:ABC transporter ATP-binding protein [Bacillota bacterium]MBQ1524058.1 ABC transporter ATP-binding protein [Bacillota bacterium]MBQ1887495.1 ABC transporter ATP-binding protein [Bacillota bacterium]MBQ3578333.1 ABC transporter ATP-binding protein [Bacillota bacterium]MBQ4181164.1 ABC transporter ATP-binding protein [Bacillota bacterium]